MLFYKGLSEIKDDILGALKILFSFDEEFNYNLVNPQASYLKIWDGFPREGRSYPCVVITNATIKPKIWGIGDEFREYTNVGQGTVSGIGMTPAKEFGGSLEFKIDFDCAAESIQEREQLADRVTMGLNWMCRKYLEEGGIIVVDVSSSGEMEKEIGNDKVFVNAVSANVWVEWSEIISYDEIRAINIRMQEIMDIRRQENLTTSEAIKTWSETLKDNGQWNK